MPTLTGVLAAHSSSMQHTTPRQLNSDQLIVALDEALDRGRAAPDDDESWRTEVATIFHMSHVPHSAVQHWLRVNGHGYERYLDEVTEEAKNWLWKTITGKTLTPSGYNRDAPPKVSLDETANGRSLLKFVWTGLFMQLGQTKSGYRLSRNKLLRTVLHNEGTDLASGRVTAPFDSETADIIVNRGGGSVMFRGEGVEAVDQPPEVTRTIRKHRNAEFVSSARVLSLSLGIPFPRRPECPAERMALFFQVRDNPRLAHAGFEVCLYGDPEDPTETVAALSHLWESLTVPQLIRLSDTSRCADIAHALMLGTLAPIQRGAPTQVAKMTSAIAQRLADYGVPTLAARKVAKQAIASETDTVVVNKVQPRAEYTDWLHELAPHVPSRTMRRVVFDEVIGIIRDNAPSVPIGGIETPTRLAHG